MGIIEADCQNGVLNKTVISFTLDHGDLPGDHNLFRKSLPYEGSTNIPFLIYDPGNVLDIGRNKIVSEPIELMDVMPTLLDVADAQIPETVDGRSILPLIRKKEVEWREYIHGEHSYGNESNHFVVTGTEKYIWHSQTGEEQYFDLVDDPQELRNLVGDEKYKDRVRYWRDVLIKELEDREEGYSDGKELIVGRPVKACLSHIL